MNSSSGLILTRSPRATATILLKPCLNLVFVSTATATGPITRRVNGYSRSRSLKKLDSAQPYEARLPDICGGPSWFSRQYNGSRQKKRIQHWPTELTFSGILTNN